MKKALLFLVLGLLALTLCACGGGSFDMETFTAQITDSQTEIMTSAVDLSNIAKLENSYWDALERIGGTIDYEKMTESSLETFTEKTGKDLDGITADYSAIGEQYKTIIEMGADGDLAEEILAEYKKLYDAYDGMHRLVLEPSGSFSAFVSNYNDFVKNLKSSDSKLTTLTTD